MIIKNIKDMQEDKEKKIEEITDRLVKYHFHNSTIILAGIGLYLTLLALSFLSKKEDIIKTNEVVESEKDLVVDENIKSIERNLLDGKNKVDEITTKVLEESKVEKKAITISAIGDCTIGTDTHFGYENSFTDVLDSNNRDFSYFFRGVKDVLDKDDLTIANLETTLTEAGEEYRVSKKFNFKGDNDYVNILKEGSVEVVNLANNHMHDYGERGYIDTKSNLEMAGIPYFGYEDYQIINVEGIKIGLAGFTGFDLESAKVNTKNAIDYLKSENVDLIIMTYHFGIEREYMQNSSQIELAHYAIDEGASLVLGHHPHVLQGIENYNGKYIVYSLGNFVFGGNRNPSDKDTMIFQEIFYYENDILVNTKIDVIPCSLSSRSDKNDYQPTILEGEELRRVRKKIEESSPNW